MASIDENGFLDQLYGAAVDPSLWVPVMEAFADMIGGTSAWLSRLNVEDGSGSGILARIDPVMPARYLGYYAERNPLNNVKSAHDYARDWRPRILTDEDWMPKDELVRSEYYNDFMLHQNVHSVLMVRLALHDDEVCVLNVNRPRAWAQFDGADLEVAAHYHPHLIRAFELSRALAADRELNQQAASVFDQSSHGLFLLDRDARVLKLNRAAERLARTKSGLSIIGGRLTATSADAARRLSGLVGDAFSSDPMRRAGGSMALPAAERALPLSVTVAPLGAESAPFFHGEPCALVCATDLEAGVSLPEQKLRDLFALTRAEARLAMALFEGARPREAAAALGISANTANVHLTRIFEKTGANRQSALIGLMMRTVGVHLN